MKRDFIFVIATLFSLVASAYDAKIDGIYYNFPGNYAEVTYKNDKHNSYSGAVVIPATVTYKGITYPVTSIGEKAFSGCVALSSVTIPNTVTSIGESAFNYCHSLTTITISRGVTNIGAYAFSGCKALTTITIPKSVTRIGKGAFYHCHLEKVIVPDIAAWCGIKFGDLQSNPLQNGNGCHIFSDDTTEITDLVIPEGVTRINSHAFEYCRGLTSVVIPNSVTSIDYAAFRGCEALTSINIPNSLKWLSGSVFSGCSSLTSITIPDGVTTIGDNTFYGCKSLTSINIPHSVTKIGLYAFEDCNKLKSIRGLREEISLAPKVFSGCPYSFREYLNTFDNYAYNYVHPRIKEWQKKGDFETRVEYQARITKENQQKKIQELQQEAIKEYTTKEHPLKVELGSYDADYEIYTLNSNYGNKYIKVPKTEAPGVKDSFGNATFDATYFNTENGLQVNEITVNVNGKSYRSEQSATDIAAAAPILEIDLPEVEIPIEHKPQPQQQQPQQPRQQQQQLAQNSAPVTAPVAIDKSIDQNIPSGISGNDKTFAVIIGNEKYTQVAHVPYAANDAKIFAEYCKKTLGLPEKNVRQYENATFGTILTAVSDIRNIAQAYNGDINVIFYYAGHGIPNESTRDAFLLPVDANGQQTEACYPLSRLYKELGELGAKNVTVFLDACFSGSQRGEGMLASARGVVVVPKIDNLQGNVVVFSAATGSETAYPYEEKGHGLFTYFLLKKLRDTKGDCTLGELGEYIQTNVRQQSVVVNRKSQTPTVVPSQSLMENWKTMKLK